MKIEHYMLHSLVKTLREKGFKTMAETDGLYNYHRQETVWVEIDGIARRNGSTDNLCLRARRIGKKHFHPVAITHFTGNIGYELPPNV